jgi:hypothetical protein
LNERQANSANLPANDDFTSFTRRDLDQATLNFTFRPWLFEENIFPEDCKWAEKFS